MTNSAIRAFLTIYGDRVFTINLDNNRTIFIGYNGGTTINDIEVVGSEADGTDENIIVHHTMNFNGTILKYSTYHSSDSVQWIGIMDEGSNMYRPNPIEFK